MEPDNYSFKEKLIMCFYEFLGTSMLTLGYNFTSAGLAVGMNLFVGIILAGKVSGGMFNPAVTIGVYTAEAKFLKEIQMVIMIIASQILGAFFGIFYAHMVLGVPEYLCPFDQKVGCLIEGQHGKVFLLEFWCTFFFVICILCQIDKRAAESKDGILKAAAIAFTLLAMIQFGGPISGGCFNPAFGLTQTIYQVIYINSQGGEGSEFARYLWVYIFAPSLGGLAASLFMRFIHKPNIHAKEESSY